ncbi:DMT family transporter [Gemmatimonas aurantiaca]|uniref:DMT family transporter n=1 Tax=Gemmatimonas aurantiaca TaxID=173480 RepID=UPI00301DDA9E
MTHATPSLPVVPRLEAWRAAAKGDFGLIVVPGVIWGASFLFIAEGLHATGPHGVAFFRILAGFLTLLAFPAARTPIAWEAWPRIALLGVLWMAIPLTLFPYAEQRISSAMAGMLNGAVPLFATAIAALLARRAPSRTVLTGLAVGMSGVVLVALPNLRDGGAHLDGVLLVLVAITLYGISINIARPLQMEYGALPVLVRALGFAAVLTAPLGIPEVLHGTWTLMPLVSLLTLGMLGTGIAYVIGTVAAGRLGAARASASIFITAPVALLLGMLVLHEHVAVLSIVGAITCIAGAMIIRRPDA